MTDERRRLLEAIGADARQLSELGPGAMSELEQASADRDVKVEAMQSFSDTTGTRFSEDPHFFYVLTKQGAEKIGLDPDELV